MLSCTTFYQSKSIDSFLTDWQLTPFSLSMDDDVLHGIRIPAEELLDQ